jgi:cell division transport system permease protein
MLQKEQHPTTIRNYFYAMMALTVLLYLLGVLGVIVVSSNSAITYVRENIPFYVELQDSANDAEVFRFQKQLESSEFVKRGSVHYISEEEAMQELIADEELQLSEEDIMMFGENLLPNAITFNLKSEYLGKYDAFLKDIKSNEFVADVYHVEEIAKNSAISLERIGLVTILLVIFFIFVATTLIKNTLKLSILSNREYIRIMQISGATEDYLAQPYIKNSVRNALICGGIAILLLIFTILILQLQPNSDLSFGNWGSFSLVFLAVLAIGMLTFWLSTKHSIRKYITKGIEEWSW